mmetsp:Transcript_16724/g.27437  ORF Transcript_16724/g.27437 Transcript_16724/m.27437 type:complete len:371 (+) Transcript_16724:308-1420(+)
MGWDGDGDKLELFLFFFLQILLGDCNGGSSGSRGILELLLLLLLELLLLELELLLVLRVDPARVVELPEEVKVGGVHKDRGKDEEDADGVLVKVGLGALAREVVVGPADAHEDADDHLGELDLGDALGPGGDDAAGAEIVVVVHEGVDEGVDREEDPADRHVRVGDVPGVEQDGRVVVPVEEDDAFLLEDEQEGVKELDDLGEREEPGAEQLEAHPEALLFGHADSCVEATRGVDVEDVGRNVGKHYQRQDRQREVPVPFEFLQVHRWAVLHHLGQQVHHRQVQHHAVHWQVREVMHDREVLGRELVEWRQLVDLQQRLHLLSKVWVGLFHSRNVNKKRLVTKVFVGRNGVESKEKRKKRLQRAPSCWTS